MIAAQFYAIGGSQILYVGMDCGELVHLHLSVRRCDLVRVHPEVVVSEFNCPGTISGHRDGDQILLLFSDRTYPATAGVLRKTIEPLYSSGLTIDDAFVLALIREALDGDQAYLRGIGR